MTFVYNVPKDCNLIVVADFFSNQVIGGAGIYKITNKINEKIYIGSAKNLSKRECQHFWFLKNNRHANFYLQNEYNKYGKENFIFETILKTDCLELLLDFEQNYLDEYWDEQKQCYNICKNATAVRFGLKVSNQTKEKMSVSQKKLWTDEYREKFKQIINTVEVKQKIRKNRKILSGESHPMFGKKHKPETIKKLSEQKSGNLHPMFGKPSHMRGRKNPKISELMKTKIGGKNYFSKAILSIEIKEGYKIFKTFESVADAARFYNINGKQISKVLTGKNKSAKNKTLKFRYKNENK